MRSELHFTYQGVYAPLAVRLVNSFARIAGPAFKWPATLKMENLLEKASKKTGLYDWGDPRFKKALKAVVDSIDQEGNLTSFGRFTLRQFLTDNLCNRLRVIEVLKRFPEIRQQKIQKPIFITGWYRTGTTHLHNLLASLPNVRIPLFWELRHPCPSLNPRTAESRWQIRKVNLATKIHRYLAPGFNVVHPMQAEQPEECLHLFEKACAGTTAFFITEAKSIAWWLLDNGLRHGYEFFKIQLQLLNWLRPGQQWVLKWPYHLWHLDDLLETFPDAVVVHLHRDPCETIASVSSLAALARSPFCASIDDVALGQFWLDYCEAGIQRSLISRQDVRQGQIMDIRYQDMMTHPLATIEPILDAADLTASEAWRNSLQAQRARKPKKHRRHIYALSQFGLNPNEVRERFKKYIETFDFS